MPDGKRSITVRLDEDLYRELEEAARREGFKDVESFVVSVIASRLRGGREAEDSLRARIARIVQDEVNKHMQALENVRRLLSDLYERVDKLEEQVKSVAERAEAQRQARRPERKRTGFERLREDKVLFEGGLPPKIQRDRFFEYLKREGAVVIELSKERVAVDPDYWNEFRRKVFEELRTNSEEEAKKLLDEKGIALFRALRDDGLIYFDPKTRRWRPVEGLGGSEVG
ncbi:MAG: CopG family transcriptional regulator [Desulfurococcaceae archaeon]